MQAKKTGIIILAAGASSRLGQPKQLLPYVDNTLLHHSIQVAIDSMADTVIVVLGAHAEQIEKEIDSHLTSIVVNHNWQEGMASSIKCGINALIETIPQTESAILMLCDQPHVTTTLLNNLITTHHKTGKAIVASSYNNTAGAPALFHKSIFPELLQLNGDVGARAIIKQRSNDVEVIEFPKGNIDIDTWTDFDNFQKMGFK